MSSRIDVRDVVDGAILIGYPDADEEEANRRAVAAARGLAARPPAGLLDAVPAARTLLVLFDPRRLAHEHLARTLRKDRENAAVSRDGRRTLHVPVFYGGEAGPDLEELARSRGLSAGEAARRHAAADYRVAFLGFAPGFPYLTGLPLELHAPRLATPRTRVATGSVGIGGPYTGVYPEETPGGWRLIGRAPVRLFDPYRDPPALLLPGDRVRFQPIDRAEFERGRICLQPPADLAGAPGRPLFALLDSGAWTSVQGGPRYGWSRYGVAPGGAMDCRALARGNALLGNVADTAALEVTLSGPRLEILSRAKILLAGSQPEAQWNGKPLAVEEAREVGPGDSLRIGRVKGGARTYLCVAGGLARRDRPEPTRRLVAGDTVERSDEGSVPSREQILRFAQDDRGAVEGGGQIALRVLLGPQEESFEKEGLEVFLREPYRVSPESDRRGVRLEGPKIAHRHDPDIPPEGTALGSIQVPRDGQPIVLGPDRPVTGGYAKIATVIGADFPLLARAAAGTAVRFRAVPLAEALEARSRMAP